MKPNTCFDCALRHSDAAAPLQKRLQPLPRDVERRLQVLDIGYSRGVFGQDVVIVEDRTQRIMDIITRPDSPLLISAAKESKYS